jgi:hypothetical protein
MAIAVTNLRSVTAVGGAASTTLAYLSAVTAGSTLFGGGANFNGSHASPAISDGVNGSWAVQSYATVPVSASIETWLATFENTGAGTPTVTNNPAGASADVGIFFIGEATGSSTPTSVDKSGLSHADGGSKTPFVASGVLAQANELLLAVTSGTWGGTPAVTSITADPTYTTIVSNPDQSTQLGHAQYKIVATTTSDQADWTIVPATAPDPGDGVAIMMSIKAAAAATGDTQEWMTKPASMRMRFERSILY